MRTQEVLWDQHILNDVAETAGGGVATARRAGGRLRFPGAQRDAWEARPLSLCFASLFAFADVACVCDCADAQRATQPAPFAWRLEPHAAPPGLAGGAAAAPSSDDPLRANSDGAFLAWHPLRVPPPGTVAAADAMLRMRPDEATRDDDAPAAALRRSRRARALREAADEAGDASEAMLAAPAWLFAGWSGVVSAPAALGAHGWWAQAPPTAPPAVAMHLVGAVHKARLLIQALA
jgi:hypothetical protein